MTGRSLVVGTALAALVLCLLPSDAWAWTPGTHVYLGETVLANLARLPEGAASLLRAFPYDFLYGNIAADTSIAKKYVPVGRHCHSWTVGQEILERAESEKLRAFALGYLSHLAADCVAHNFFVPRQLVITSRTIALGHSYWESRFETHLGEQYARTAMDVIRVGHDDADAHLDAILAPTIFSVRTSRRLFRGMVGITETQSWQRVFRVASEASRWDIADQMVEAHMATAYEYVMDMLSGDTSMAHKLDPSGEASLGLAKRMRIDVMKRVSSPPVEELVAMADEHFRLPPDQALPFWADSSAVRPWHHRALPGDRESG